MNFDCFNPFEEVQPFESSVISVSALNRRVALMLQNGFPSLWVRGEIRGFMQAASGHWYFTLKDEAAEVRCAMFAGANRRLNFYPKTGDKVEVHARVSLYQPRGEYQLVVDGMRQAGLGNLYEAFLRLKDKLQREGLFDAQRKKAIPSLAWRIGVVTSLQSAALRDVITTLSRRAPYAKIVIYPTSVQGNDAPAEIVQALRAADERQEVDVLLLVRGGGSLQDLWAFNDENVARALVSMRLPVIVGVGHESDTTIADWVADCRAATPTAAAEMATTSIDVLLERQARLQSALIESFDAIYQDKVQRLDWAQAQLRTPKELLDREQTRLTAQTRALDDMMSMKLDRLDQCHQIIAQRLSHVRPQTSVETVQRVQHEIDRLYSQRLQMETARLAQLQVVLEETDPRALLKRGYSMVTDESGRVVQKASELDLGQMMTIVMSDGEVTGEVKRVVPKTL